MLCRSRADGIRTVRVHALILTTQRYGTRNFVPNFLCNGTWRSDEASTSVDRSEASVVWNADRRTLDRHG